MARKSVIEDIIDGLVDAPWQVGAVLSGVFFVLFLFSSSPFLHLMFMAFTGISIMGTLGSLFKHFRDGKIFNGANSLADVKALSWRDFEHLVGEYYRRKGFAVEGMGGNGPDGGIDLIARNAEGQKIIIQCKQWRAYKIPVQVVREVYGVMVDQAASGAAIMTSGTFTQDAKDFAVGKPMELIDGTRLARLIAEVKTPAPKPAAPYVRRAVLIPTEPPPLVKEEKDLKFMPPAMRTELENKGKAFSEANPLCPACKKHMVLRVAHKGPTPGAKFWGCVNYPACRHTAPFQAET